MLLGSLLRFSSKKDETQERNNASCDDLMSKNLSKKVASLTDKSVNQSAFDSDSKHLSLDDLSRITRRMLLDKNLEVSKVRPFFWTMVETYVDRFQVFPFDAIKALFSYLELREYPEQQLRDLVEQIELLYEKQYGKPMREQSLPSIRKEDKYFARDTMLEDEINELRETLKFAAIVGERTDDLEKI